MEFANPLSNFRTQLCIVMTGFNPVDVDRDLIWGLGAEDFLRRMHKLGVHITIVGPRPPRKFGSKKTIRFMDRHEVIGMKVLEASKSHELEFRILSSKTRSWTRLRAEACVVLGPYGAWPTTYEGWTLPGTLSIQALSRWVGEFKQLPGRDFAFIGSSNQVVRWASILLDRGAKSCYVVESNPELRCWRSYRDRFLAKGGRVLSQHHVERVELNPQKTLQMFLKNEQGTMLHEADCIVFGSANDDALNLPGQWKNGLYYVQRRMMPWEKNVQEEDFWLEGMDWREVYWRMAKFLGVVDHSESEGALKLLRAQRREMLAYRKPGRKRDLGYSGKILDRETMSAVQSVDSVPRTFAHPKPVASLECFENVPCRACADACPENAIEVLKLNDLPRLLEDKCTGCGACVAVCPAGAAIMIRELPQQQKARYFLPDDTKELWKQGRGLQLLNRKGDYLGMGRVVSSLAHEDGLHRLLEIETTNVHLWDARNFRIPRSDFDSEELDSMEAHDLKQKRGWVTVNGVKRLSPVDIPLTMALWQLGYRRFEDALFCHDGGCHLCEVTVDGKQALACRALIRDKQEIAFVSRQNTLTQPLCVCKQVNAKEYLDVIADGASPRLARELTGVANGTCHGRWCCGMKELAPAKDGKSRPNFHGYEGSPWRDVWAADVVDPATLKDEEK